MNVLEKLAELTTKTGDLTDELLKFRTSRTIQENFRFDFSTPLIEIQIPFRITLGRPLFVGIRNLIIKKNTGASGGGQSLSVSYAFGIDEVSFDFNTLGGVSFPSVVDLSQFPTYFFPRDTDVGQEDAIRFFLQHNLTANSFSLLSQGESSLFVTYI